MTSDPRDPFPADSGKLAFVLARWMLVGLLAVGCEPGEGTLVVQVRTDFAPGVELASVRTRIGARVDTVLAGDSSAWGSGVRVAELVLPRGEQRLVVSALGRDERVLAERPVRVDVEALTVVTVLLTRDCAGVECPGAGDPSETACLAGRCVDAGCTAESTEGCGDPACASAAECPTGGPCAAADCVAGACFLAPDHASCAAGEVCEPDRGCADADVRARPFDPPVLISELSSDLEDEDPTLTPDALEVVFARYAEGGLGDLFTSTRASTGAPWDPPRRVDELATAANEYNPAFGADGLTLYFARAEQVYMSTRGARGEPWGEPRVVALTEPGVSAACPGPSADEFELAYCTYGAGGLYDLFLTRRADPATPFGPGAEVMAISGPEIDGSPYLRVPGALVLYYSTTRSLSFRELYHAMRPSRDADFRPGAPLVELNGAHDNQDPWLSDDERTIVFASNRDGSYDLYTSSR